MLGRKYIFKLEEGMSLSLRGIFEKRTFITPNNCDFFFTPSNYF